MTEIQVYSRDEWVKRYLRSYQIRVPGADVREGTQPWIDAMAIADQLVVQSGVAKAIALGQTLEGKTTEELDKYGQDIGVARPPATGAIGWAVMGDATSTLGTTPLFGAELIEPTTGLSFRFTGSGTYYAGDSFPVAANSTGPATNLNAGTTLLWSSPPPGCDPLSLVEEQPDGTGLGGGRDPATNEEYVLLLRQAQSEPASAGNDAAYIELAEHALGHGVPVQKAFTYAGVFGPGTTAIAFVLKASRPGASRTPSAPQIAAVDAYIGEKMPRDDGRFLCVVVPQNRDVYLKLDWSTAATGWTDLAPWPPYYSTTAGAPAPATVTVSSVTDSTHFVLKTANAGYAGVAQPSAGQTIGFYDKAKGEFRRKRILSFTGTGPWTITCDTASGASDESYTPVVDQPAVPWSESLNLLVAPVGDYLAGFGPGEQFASFYDDGRRQRRWPRPPKDWPITFTSRVENGVFDLDAIESVSLAEGDGGATTVGTPGTTSYLQELRYLSAYPKS